MNYWSQVKEEIRDGSTLTSQQYAHWVDPVRYSHVSQDGTLHVDAPNENVKAWLETACRPRILEAIQRLGLDVVGYEVEVEPPVAEPTQGVLDFGSGLGQFNPKYTFGRYVVGACNEFAHAASQAVVSSPARAYNPLFLYSGVGMGKTHLLHAIGHSIQIAKSDYNVVYTSAEEFMNEMISAIRCNNMTNFHSRYRMADMLLVDDVQILGSKERTQEEFFHTFNVLHNRGRQIVITSDSAPSRIPGLVARLRSRFSWGLLADIQPPDLETKMAILDTKSREAGAPLAADVCSYVASHQKSNIRELEGLLNRLMARAKFTNSQVTVSMARQVLGSPRFPHQNAISIDAIKESVAMRYGISPENLAERGNAREITHPRQVAMYLVRKLTKSALAEIGRSFGKHHTTVLHSIRKVKGEMKSNETTRLEVEGLLATLKR